MQLHYLLGLGLKCGRQHIGEEFEDNRQQELHEGNDDEDQEGNESEDICTSSEKLRSKWRKAVLKFSQVLIYIPD